jgi:polyhydroxyalkanoate synthase subunit PhaC
MFSALDPTLTPRKYDAVARWPDDSAKLDAFAELEDWINDGVALAAPVARECVAGWYGRNSTVAGTWRIAGRAVDPTRFTRPALVVVPAADRIVPPASAMALARALPNAEIMTPRLGHIGMVMSSAARAQMWDGLAAWSRRLPTAASSA